SVFRLNSDGSFERRFLQTLPDEWQTPAFGIETNGDIIILNSPGGENDGKFPKLLRYHPDGTLKETITTPYRLRCCYGYGLDRIEFLADGSFLAHWLDENDGPTGIFPHHWVGFKADGEPLDFVSMYLSVTNLVRGSAFQVEESTDLQLWQPAGPTYNFGDSDAV